MIQRCENPNQDRYKDYGGRGIAVCDRWHKFKNFLADMGEPKNDLTLDRKNNDLGYCAKNCRWANRHIQAINSRPRRRSRRTSIFKGVSAVTGTSAFQARITIDGRILYLGSFPSEIEAALAFNKAAQKYLGCNAYLNKI